MKKGKATVQIAVLLLIICCITYGKGIGYRSYADELGEHTETTETTEAPSEVIEEPKELAGVTLKKLSAGHGEITVQWKKSRDEITGYQVAYSTKKDRKAKDFTKKRAGSEKASLKLKGLKSGKTYYVWVRSYLDTGSGRSYSNWSKPKKAATLQYLVAIDAGHQSHENTGKEANGPGSTVMKTKVTGGTKGKYTGQTEYELNLAVAKKLEKELTKRGYKVLMIRTSNDVNISNVERAQIANKAKADAFIRIHANGSDSESANGAMTICQTSHNKYCKATYKESKKLSECVLKGVVKNTGCKKESVWETDTMTGINWCQIPVTIVEMGYLTNEKEDRLLARDSYRKKMAIGIANGVDDYFGM